MKSPINWFANETDAGTEAGPDQKAETLETVGQEELGRSVPDGENPAGTKMDAEPEPKVDLGNKEPKLGDDELKSGGVRQPAAGSQSSEDTGNEDGQIDLGEAFLPNDDTEGDAPNPVEEARKKVLQDIFGEEVSNVQEAKKRWTELNESSNKASLPELGDFGKAEYVIRKEAAKEGKDPDMEVKQAMQRLMTPPSNMPDDAVVAQYIWETDGELRELYEKGDRDAFQEQYEESIKAFQGRDRLSQKEVIKHTRERMQKEYDQEMAAYKEKYATYSTEVTESVSKMISGSTKVLQNLDLPSGTFDFEGVKVGNIEPISKAVKGAFEKGDLYELVTMALGDPEKNPEDFVKKLYGVILRESPRLEKWRQANKDRLTASQRQAEKAARESVAMELANLKSGKGANSKQTGSKGASGASNPRLSDAVKMAESRGQGWFKTD